MSEEELIEHMERMLAYAKAKEEEVSEMPLTKKGKKIMKNMKDQYGAKKGKSVFYASDNKGRIKGVHRKKG